MALRAVVGMRRMGVQVAAAWRMAVRAAAATWAAQVVAWVAAARGMAVQVVVVWAAVVRELALWDGVGRRTAAAPVSRIREGQRDLPVAGRLARWTETARPRSCS